MVMKTLNGYVTLQEPATTQAAPRAAATTSREAQRAADRASQDAERAADKALADQIREEVRTSVTQARQGRGPDRPREFTIQGPNGRTVIGIPNSNDMIPPQAVDISLAFFFTVAAIIIGLPIARAFARRMDRKTTGTAQIPTEVTAQLAHLNQAVDAIAVEVERISEGQRFTTRLLSEQRDLARQTLPSAAER